MQVSHHSEVGVLKSVFLKHAKDAFANDAQIDRQWNELGYLDRPDLGAAIAEYDAFVDLFKRLNVPLRFHRIRLKHTVIWLGTISIIMVITRKRPTTSNAQ